MYTTSPSADFSSLFCCLGVLLLVFSLDLILEGTLRFLLGVKDTLSFFVHLVQAVVYEWLQQLITILILLRVAINFLFSLILLFSVSHFLTRPSLSSSYGPILLNWHKIYYKRYIWIMLNIFFIRLSECIVNVLIYPTYTRPYHLKKDRHPTVLGLSYFFSASISYILHASWLLGPGLWHFVISLQIELQHFKTITSQWSPISYVLPVRYA